MRRKEFYGEDCYVDYSGMTILIHDRKTVDTRPAQVFVGVLGGSSYSYCGLSGPTSLPRYEHLEISGTAGGAQGKRLQAKQIC